MQIMKWRKSSWKIKGNKRKVQGCNWKNGSDMLDSKVCTRNY